MAKKSKVTRQPSVKRYFLLTASMLISEEMSKVVIAKNPEKAEELVEDDLTFQDFSTWNSVGQDIKSAFELDHVRELTHQEFKDYKKQFP
jgi:hypothetical protein